MQRYLDVKAAAAALCMSNDSPCPAKSTIFMNRSCVPKHPNAILEALSL